MALMNTLRNKMGKVVVGMITLAILSFVLTDLLGGQNSIFLSGNDRTVGEIAGESVDIEEYQKIVENMKLNYRNNFGRSPGEMEERTLRDQAWQYLIIEKAFTKIYLDAGVEVGNEELFDMVQGKNVSPDIQQIFINPATGQFDKERLIQTIASLNTTPQGREQWADFERNLIPGRLRVKYDNLMVKTSISTKQEGERAYQNESSVAEAKYLYVPLFAISDTSITASDAEMNAYINSNKDDFKVNWSKSVKLVAFPIISSSDDSLSYRDELRELKEEFQTATEDSVYASVITDKDPFFTEYAINELPDILQSNLNILNKGDVIGPYLDNNDYVLFKISDVFEGPTGFARASHILIKWDDESVESKAKARNEASIVLRNLKAGADFAETAKDNSKDGSAIRGGDLGWFDSEKMVEPFSNAVFGAKKTGLLPNIVESEFGYHIINVTETPSYTKYKIAMIRREILPSDETRDRVFRKADYFAGTSSNETEFDSNAAKDTLIVLEAEDIEQDDYNVAQLGSARQIVSWLFNTAEEGEVSSVYEIGDQYVIAVMTDEIEEGTADLASVKLEVEKKVKDEKIGKIISDKLAGLEGTIDERAEAFGNDVSVYESCELSLNSYSLPSVGTAPEAVGALFSMNNGDFSRPIITENGVVVLNLINFTKAAEIADYTSYKYTLEQETASRASYYVSESINDWAAIIDTRYKFY